MECMAVQPEYQWISEHKMLKSTMGVITNIRPDHIEEMGPTMTDITKSLGNTIPGNKAIIIAPSDHQDTLQKIANDKNSKLVITDPDEIESSYMEKFSHLEHKENVALSLEVCTQLGIEKDTALEGMLTARKYADSSIGRVFPFWPLTDWFIKNIGWKLFFRNIDHFLRLGFDGLFLQSMDVYQNVKTKT